MTVRTFSGAHPFRPACLIEAYQFMASNLGHTWASHERFVR